ncbi:DUF5082 family protein [Virgibacillus sp. 179-BFC.A HS]|uniref:DUF5082 family protein n=1 Tax=Tigheibacillus jepli TaxID=3035914 RepID=A0ABU5CEC4_9BACI|nr:DUF5082 family protein [Virgibacillus sp. 179-BFC.A HS]MDY0404687.1 DUF5082 family protein [Virgibacillus sp. 179-BFC.A HS]
MSDEATFLKNASSHISGSIAEIDAKIERLRTANQEIAEDQSHYMGEIHKIKEPELDPLWIGERGNDYDESREAAYDTMKSILDTDYENKMRAIETQISILQSQRGFLTATSAIVDAANDLLQKGEDAVEALGNKISEISGRLFG